MKVLHLLGAVEDSGGVLSVIRNLLETTRHRGWSHLVWVNELYRESRTPVLNYRFSRYLLADSPNHWRLLFRALRAYNELKTLLQEESFDLLHAHSRGGLVVGLMAAGRLRRPVVFTNHGFARRTALYRWAAGRKNVITAVLTPNMLRHYKLNAKPGKIVVISECCSDRFFQEPLRSDQAPSGDRLPVRLVGLGGIVRWKNWHLVLKALAHLGQDTQRLFEFHQWGPTALDADSRSYEDELRQWVRTHPLACQVFFHGPTNDITTVLRQADWFVLPSTDEPCSVALIEALAMGIPALVSASGGNIDIVSAGQSGLLFRPDDCLDLAAQLRLAARRGAVQWGPAEIRKCVLRRSASHVAEEYARLYASVGRGGSRRDGSVSLA